MTPDVPTFKVLVFTNGLRFLIEVLEVNILTQILLTLLTFITLPILRKISVCRRWFLFGVSYYVNFQFTPFEEWSMDNNMVSKIWVGISTTDIHSLNIHLLIPKKTV